MVKPSLPGAIGAVRSDSATGASAAGMRRGPSADELHTAPVARVAPRDMPHELATQIPRDLRPTAGRRAKAPRPALDLVVDVRGREIGKAPLDERAVHVGR